MSQASYFYFGSDLGLHDTCAAVLGHTAAYRTQQPRHLLKVLQRSLPSFIVVDYATLSQKTLNFLVQIRHVLPAAAVPLVIVTDIDALEPSVQEAIFQFPHSITIDPQLLSEDLTWQLEMMLEGHSLDRPEERPHPYALEILARLWRLELSGVLELIENHAQITICKGGLVSPQSLSLLEKGLYGQGFRFSPSEQSGFGDWISVGQLLWTAAQHSTNVGFLKNRLHLTLARTPKSGRLSALDLPPKLHEIISDVPTKSLTERFKRHLARPTQMEKNIEALFLLGLICFPQFIPPPTQASPSEAPQRQNHTVPSLSTLYLEYTYLQNQDDWEILGLLPSHHLNRIKAAAHHRRQLYLKMIPPDTHPKETVMIYQLVHRVDSARDAILSVLKTYRSFGIKKLPRGEAELYFQAAHSAFHRRQFDVAYTAFEEALRLKPNSNRMMILTAWSAFHVGRYKRALDLAECAQKHTPEHSFIQRCYAIMTAQLKSAQSA